MDNILTQAYEAWSSASALRSRRLRYKRYTYGDQWSDIVSDSSGKLHVERDFIEQTGGRPIINNLIRQLVKTIVGRFRSDESHRHIYDGPMKDVARLNCLPELDSRLLEEFLISGCAVQRIAREERMERERLWVDNVDIRRFFVNKFSDPRGSDIDLVGMLHDMTYPELVRRFGRGSRRRAAVLKELYSGSSPSPGIIGVAGSDGDFFLPADRSRCRVVEVWTLDSRSIVAGDDIAIRFRWHCRWLAPDGTVLAEYDSPYSHGGHPFAVKFYPLTDGEVHSFVEDVIEQQRSINRMLVLIDRMISTSAKGVLLFPVDQMTKGMTWQDVCQRWAQADGVIPISGRGEHLPQQVMSNPGNSGAYQFLQLQMKLFEDISGVSDSLSGRGASGARGAELYESQVRNATIALGDIFETFVSFLNARNEKAVTSGI